MKKILAIFAALFINYAANCQCTVSGFDVCTGSSPVTSFTGNTLISGNSLKAGSKYKFTNITTGIGALDAIITIDDLSNATITNIDDDLAGDELGVAGTQAALFSPTIAPQSNLACSDKRGYVQFTITFYNHYTANTLPAAGVLPVVVSNLNFLHFDMDGHTVGSNGWFREIGYVQKIGINPVNFGAAGTELTNGGTITDGGSDWLITYGSTTERNGVSRCAQVIEKSVYGSPQSSVTFRMGYDYKAPVPCNSANEGKPVRQFGSKFGCFSLPSGAPLPVTLTGLSVNYNNSVAIVNWTTTQEINLAKYEVLRSIDGINFQVAGITVSRNSPSTQNYSYQDNNVPAGATILYYKLRMVDKDNAYKFSNVVTVKISGSKVKDFVITPNPASADAQIRFYAAKSGVAKIIVYDAAGKVVQQQQANVLSGNNSIAINNITKLSEGMYTIKMITNEESFSSKLIVWK